MSDGNKLHEYMEWALTGQWNKFKGTKHRHQKQFRIDYLWAHIKPLALKLAEEEDPLLVEGMVWGEGFAGTVDYVGRNKKTGVVTLRDWKTSKYRKLPGHNDDKLCNYRL